MSLKTPDRIRNLQRKLYCKAKAEPTFRFYLLYDKICREDVLVHAYRLARLNAGAPGVDGMTFARIEEQGLEVWLAGLRAELVSKTYRPDPVRRVMIPKANGGERPLGIPTIRDRVTQTAAKIVIEPIFEAEVSRRLMTVPGVGPISATAIAALAPPAETFVKGRDFAAWLGLTPLQRSTGGKQKLGVTSKMGERTLRRLLIIGSSAVVQQASKRGAPKGSWLEQMLARKPRMLVIVALANKMARIIWALLVKQENYRAPVAAKA